MLGVKVLLTGILFFSLGMLFILSLKTPPKSLLLAAMVVLSAVGGLLVMFVGALMAIWPPS